MRLLAAGMRPISNVVDASNYVMLELGKPTHTFDARGRRAAAGWIVRRRAPGERLETLDHVVRDPRPRPAHRRSARAHRSRGRHGRADDARSRRDHAR